MLLLVKTVSAAHQEQWSQFYYSCSRTTRVLVVRCLSSSKSQMYSTSSVEVQQRRLCMQCSSSCRRPVPTTTLMLLSTKVLLFSFLLLLGRTGSTSNYVLAQLHQTALPRENRNINQVSHFSPLPSAWWPQQAGGCYHWNHPAGYKIYYHWRITTSIWFMKYTLAPRSTVLGSASTSVVDTCHFRS